VDLPIESHDLLVYHLLAAFIPLSKIVKRCPYQGR
jgi:hypothetical protein